jgi:perosamine synthetase
MIQRRQQQARQPPTSGLGLRVLRAARHQRANLRALIKQRPIQLSELSCGTLDRDDLRVARTWLHQTCHWGQPGVVEDFHSQFAEWNGSRYAFSFSAGRVALSACLEALDIGPGDEVILPGYTCVVVPNALRFRGAVPVYADIELQTFGLDVDSARQRLSSRTKAILIHHLYGLVCRDYEALVELARSHGLFLIEDCAHATGATFRGRNVGNLGDMAFYSSERSKIFNTVTGGVATTNDPELGERLAKAWAKLPSPSPERIRQQLLNVFLLYYTFKSRYRWLTSDIAHIALGGHHLESTTYDEECGLQPADYGAKMAAPIAALAINQLGKLDTYNEERRRTAASWKAWALSCGLSPPLVLTESIPVFLRYPILVLPEKKTHPSWAAGELGVRLGVWFTTNIHPAEHPALDCENANIAVERCVNLPCLHTPFIHHVSTLSPPDAR